MALFLEADPRLATEKVKRQAVAEFVASEDEKFIRARDDKELEAAFRRLIEEVQRKP